MSRCVQTFDWYCMLRALFTPIERFHCDVIMGYCDVIMEYCEVIVEYCDVIMGYCDVIMGYGV